VSVTLRVGDANVSVTGGRGWLGVVDTRYGVSQPAASDRGAHVTEMGVVDRR